MRFNCPHCGHGIRVQGAKPGGYQPRCDSCAKPYVLAVPAKPDQPWMLGKTMADLQPLPPDDTPVKSTSKNGDADATVARPSAPPAPQPNAPSEPEPTPLDDDVEWIPEPSQTTNPWVKAAKDSARYRETHPKPESRTPSRRGRAVDDTDDADDEDLIEAEIADGATVPWRSPTPQPDAQPGAGADDASATVASQPRSARPTPNPLPEVAAGSSPLFAGDAPTGPEPDAGDRLGGYQVVQKIGEGGMGCVYLARQLSLDRIVALKTVAAQWANDPVFLSRFTREAFAAAQLTHHNVVQIHDIHEDAGRHFFSMEFVPGRSLDTLIQKEGPMDPRAAASFALQAARGLRFAHQHGMVHRDVKPANLLLSDDGIIKVADLGLVKTTGDHTAAVVTRAVRSNQRLAERFSQLTSPEAMGTPAYMAPEQALDAAHVDARADIFALGATLYNLLTGRTPHEPKTLEQAIDKLQHEPIVSPDELHETVPPELARIVMKMLARDVDDRYQSMDDVVTALQDYTGVQDGPIRLREEQAAELQDAVDDYNDAPMGWVRLGLIAAFHLACAAAIVYGLFLGGGIEWFLGGLNAWVFGTLGYAVLLGLHSRSTLFGKSRQYLFTLPRLDWAIGAIGLIVGALLLYFSGFYVLVTAVVVATLAVVVVFHFGVDRLLKAQRAPQLARARAVLRRMRLAGADEDGVREFVCRFAGRHWEGFYEDLFGYEAKLDARRHWGFEDDGRRRPRHRVWRDWLVDWLDTRLERREQARRARYLERLEERRLRAEGVGLLQARQSAAAAASSMLNNAQAYRTDGQWSFADDGAAPDVDADSRIPDSWRLVRRSPGQLLADTLLGNRGRFLAGMGLLIAYGFWARERPGVLSWVSGTEELGGFKTLRNVLTNKPSPVRVADWLQPVMDVLCSQGTLFAGLLLWFSSFAAGKRMTAYLAPGVVLLIAAGQLSNMQQAQYVLSFREWAMVGGLCLGLLALFFGRHRY